MIQRVLAKAVAVTLGMVMLFQVGCAVRSKISSFYILSPVAGPEFEMKNISGNSGDISIGISPVSLPKYLKKPQIVTRTGSNELHLAEYDRWAGKLEEDLGQVIAENLTYLLSTDRVFSYPAIEESAPDYNIKMDISRFDGRLGDEVELIVRWAIFDGQGNIVHGVKSTHLIEPTRGGGYAEMVAAQSQALASLSRVLADAIIELSGS
jgi:uncharacterized lipoprotein YmbA